MKSCMMKGGEGWSAAAYKGATSDELNAFGKGNYNTGYKAPRIPMHGGKRTRRSCRKTGGRRRRGTRTCRRSRR